MEKLVSIVILNWNGKDVILECLESIYKLDYPNIEVIIVDNGSTDGSHEIAEEKYPEIKLIRNKENYGVAGGYNIGVKHSQGDYLLLLNNDTVLHWSLLKELVEVLEEEDVAAVGPKIYYCDEPRKIWAAGGGRINWRTGNVRLYGGDETDSGQFEEVAELDYVSGCALLSKREVFNAIGCMDETYFAYFEETDWCARAQKHGYRLLYVPQARMWHKVRSSTRNISGFHEYQMTRNLFWFMKKNLDKKDYNNFLLYFIFYKLWLNLVVYLFYFRDYKLIKPFLIGMKDGIR